MTASSDRGDLFRHARVLGTALFDALFDDDDAQRFAQLLTPDRARPVVQIRSDDDLLLSLPWELLHHGDEFLVREGRVDLIRTTPTQVAGETLLRKPTKAFKLVVNVSAPEDSRLSYEAESYRISLVTADRCPMVPTELGTLDDLIETVNADEPTGIHFSGHGAPAALVFENDEGRDDKVEVADVIQRLRQRLPNERRLPPFFYLASCHGNDPTAPDEEDDGAPSAAVQLHKAGVTEVVGYFGPILDELSTRAEETIYEAIGEGRSTRDAVRLAREELKRPLDMSGARPRPKAIHSNSRETTADDTSTAEAPADTHPFAWAQLVLYRRGPEWPLSVAVPAEKRQAVRALKRDFAGFGDRKVLKTGFIGRRLEQHKIRRRLREGDRVLVLQGLGGLGKSTLAQKVLPWLTKDPADVCTLWCQEVEGQPNRAEALVAQLLAYCRNRFGLDWEGVVQQVDQAAGDDSAKRFDYFLQVLVQNVCRSDLATEKERKPKFVLYLDNLESLLVGPQDESDDETDSATFGQWAEPALEEIWQTADQMARDSEAFYLIASCRYRNDAFTRALLPVTPLPADALFRLTEWFPALKRLATPTRARLVARLDGHPRAVEYANDLVDHALAEWRDDYGEWSLSAPPKPDELEKEWGQLVNPCLPQVDEKLKDNLLLKALWKNVLDEPARRFLYRMTILRQPAEWDLLALLGEPDEPEDRAVDTARRLRATSLLEQVELRVRVGKDQSGTTTRYVLHPATERFIRDAHADAPERLTEAHRRLGDHLESAANDSPYIETDIEAGHHLFEAGEYNRAYKLLGAASEWLQDRGRVREGLRVLEPFLDESVRTRLDRALLAPLLGTVGSSHLRLAEVAQAIEYFEQALVIAREIGDRRAEGAVLGSLGLANARLGEYEKAVGFYEKQLVISRETSDRHFEGNAFGNLGTAYLRLGNIPKAIEHFEQALVIHSEVGNRRGEGNSLGSLGNAYSMLGENRKAIEYYDQGLVISQETGHRQGEANDLGNLGIAYAHLGEHDIAIRHFEQALLIRREIGDRRGEGNDLGNLGVAYASMGEVDKAIGYHEQQLVIAREIVDRRGEGITLNNHGNAYAALGKVDKARSFFQQALAIGQQIKDAPIVEVANHALKDL